MERRFPAAWLLLLPTVGVAAVPPSEATRAAETAIATVRASTGGRTSVVVMRSDGTAPRRLALRAGEPQQVAWSPDHRLLAVTRVVGRSPRYVVDLVDARSGAVRVTLLNAAAAAWSPSGRAIAFVRGGRLCVAARNGRAGLHCITTGIEATSPSWSADGRWIAFSSSGTHSGIYKIRTNGTDLHELTDDRDGHPAWSPDGKLIAFARRVPEDSAHPSDTAPVMLHTVKSDGTGLTPLVRGERPAWSPDGSRLAFIRFSVDPIPYNAHTIGSDVFTMNRDGANVRPVTRSLFPMEIDISWR